MTLSKNQDCLQERNIENGLDSLSKSSFYFEKINKPVDIALISFLDHNYRLDPLGVLENVKSNCKNIENLPPSRNRKIDGYYLPSDPRLYTKENKEFVGFVTSSIAKASIDAHQAENFMTFDQHHNNRKYFYTELDKKLQSKSREKNSSVTYYHVQVDKPNIAKNPEEVEAIIFICIDPNLIDQALAKIVSSYGLKKYQVVALPGGGYPLVREETKGILTQYTKKFPNARVIICSHAANPEQPEEDKWYNCGGYTIYKEQKGIAAYNQAWDDMKQAKQDLEKEGIAKVDIVMNVATHMGKGKAEESKLYKATFEIV